MSRFFSFEDEILDIIDKAVYRTIRDVNKSLKQSYMNALEKYYADKLYTGRNTPYSYKRTRNLYSATNLPNINMVDSIITKNDLSSYSSIFEIGSEYITTPYTGKYSKKGTVETDWIFERAFFGENGHSIHGFSYEDVKKHNRGREQAVKSLAKRGIKAKVKYWNPKHIPKVMKTTVLSYMNKEIEDNWGFSYNKGNKTYSLKQKVKINNYLNKQISDSLKRRGY